MSYKETSSSPLNQTLIVLLPYSPRRRHRLLLTTLTLTLTLTLISVTVYLLFPSDPTIQLTKLKPTRIHIQATPIPTISLSFALTAKVRNPNFISLSYDSLTAAVGYRGGELGIVRAEGGTVKARGTELVDAMLDVDGFEVVKDVVWLLRDLVTGVVPFEMKTDVVGRLGFFFFNIPIKGRVSCDVHVNVYNQTVVRQDCYPE